MFTDICHVIYAINEPVTLHPGSEPYPLITIYYYVIIIILQWHFTSECIEYPSLYSEGNVILYRGHLVEIYEFSIPHCSGIVCPIPIHILGVMYGFIKTLAVMFMYLSTIFYMARVAFVSPLTMHFKH